MVLSLGRFLTARWLPAIEPTVRASTFTSYRGHVHSHIVPGIGRLRLHTIDAPVLNSFYGELLRTGNTRRAGGLAPATVQRVHATIHRALRDAVRWGLLEHNPASRCDPPRAPVPEAQCWSPDELAAFLAAARADELYPLWHVIAMTGMRRGEALGLRWRDVDLARGRLAIGQTLVAVGSQVRFSQPKTRRGRRVIALDDGTVGVLRAHRGATGRHALAFCRADGSPLSPGGVTKRFTELARTHGVRPIRLHDLRHTHASLALRAGIHPKVVSERLGHSSVTITLDLYSHASDALHAEAAAEVAAVVLGRRP
jgi:integrase